MKILLVTRGSQGDIYPYLGLADALHKRGHDVTISIPRLFEEMVKGMGLNYMLQAFDDIAGMVGGAPSTKELLDWTNRVIEDQFKELVPVLKDYDLFIGSNTEFAAPHIAEYCGKPFVRTSYAPLIPGKKVPSAVFPFIPPKFLVGFTWGLLNVGMNMMTKKSLNENRAELGMEPVKDQADYAPSHALNYLMCSQYLCETDPDWKYPWEIGGYCFNDTFTYNEIAYSNFMGFVKQDKRPILFFTMGSCNTDKREQFCEMLYRICKRQNYRLVVGCGWWKTGSHLKNDGDLFLLDAAVPHNIIFPHVNAIIHHGGSGTTHSSARWDLPQAAVPLIIDQFYFAHRIEVLGVGPRHIKIGKTSEKKLEAKVADLMTNPLYKANAKALGEKIRGEGGVAGFCDFVESYAREYKVGLKAASN